MLSTLDSIRIQYGKVFDPSDPADRFLPISTNHTLTLKCLRFVEYINDME
jgi:hypothetical protein